MSERRRVEQAENDMDGIQRKSCPVVDQTRRLAA
jgi:hypothetical protein